MNPLFSDDDDHKKRPKNDPGYVLPNRHGKKIQPLHDDIKPDTPHATDRPKPQHYAPAKLITSEPIATPAGNHLKKDANGSNPAVDLIRRKLETLYQDEPDTAQEVAEVTAQATPQRSKHQQFMYKLSTSGKSLAQIQTEWHSYYVNLPDDEKHQVWQEFYANNNKHTVAPGPAAPAHMPAAASQTPQVITHAKQSPKHEIEPIVEQDRSSLSTVNPIFSDAPANIEADSMVVVAETPSLPTDTAQTSKRPDKRSAAAIKRHIVNKVNLNSKAQAKALQHAKSLLFGLGSGALVLAIVLFGLFNEIVIAPFIQPSSHAGATPIILNNDGVAPSSTPEVIIPKINVEIPVDYSLANNSEEEVQKGLESGVVHYPTTVKPGEKGNAAFFGHSSNNIFNPGKYKFAFVLLHELAPGDIFYLTYEGKAYTYKVYDKQIVSPDQVSVLNSVEGKTATATLITCDPPGTSLNRLVVWGEQISPDPSGAVDPAQSNVAAKAQPEAITGNGPSLWKRITSWVTGNGNE
jgi:LPXTG-site transpeptidase (sortase) family protein